MISIPKFLRRFISNDIGIDLGTANCLVFAPDRGVVLNEPSVVAVNKVTGEIRAVGMEAKAMLGRTPGTIEAIRPMKDGVIADYEITESMIRYFINKMQDNAAGLARFVPPRVLVAVPYGITQVEYHAVHDSAIRAGADSVYLIEEPLASAIGVGLPTNEPQGSMIVDIGGGTTEVAVISLGSIVVAKSLKVAGDSMDRAIITHMKNKHSLLIGERDAEDIKQKIGTAYPLKDEETLEVRGRDNVGGLPKAVMVTGEEIRNALLVPMTGIAESITQTLELCPPSLAGDLMDNGIMLAGGGALIEGIDSFLSEATHLPVFIAENPLQAVANGTGIVLQHIDHYPDAFMQIPR